MRKRIVLALGLLCLMVLIQGTVLTVLNMQIRKATTELNQANSMTTEINSIEMQHW